MGVKSQPRSLLATVEGLTLNELRDPEVCCGFGGTFCVKYPDISTRMVSDKVAGVEASGADTLVGGDLGCLMNISGRLTRLGKSVKVYHAAEILAGMADGPGIGEEGSRGADGDGGDS
jgi:L-lactate dehydrogenase complex protein LldE